MMPKISGCLDLVRMTMEMAAAGFPIEPDHFRRMAALLVVCTDSTRQMEAKLCLQSLVPGVPAGSNIVSLIDFLEAKSHAKRKLEYLSEHLIATRNRLADNRHGGVVLLDEELESFIRRFDEFVSMARDLEFEVSRREWNDRAARDRSYFGSEPPIGGNVVAFHRSAASRPTTGGDAA